MGDLRYHTWSKRTKRRAAAVVAGLAALVAAWFMVSGEKNPEELRFVAAGSDAQARALVARMVEVNKPWLEPAALRASYSLQRTLREYSLQGGRRRTQQTQGPYTIAPDSPQEVRVGALVWTPLHAMVASQPGPHVKRWFRHGDEGGPVDYTVRMLGQTTWKGKQVVAVEVNFASPERCLVGTGGQVDGTYEVCAFVVQRARILLDARRAVPVLVGAGSTATNANTFRWECVWEFSPQFFEVAGGLAPQAFEWRPVHGDDTTRFRQEFQIFNNTWLFKRGASVWHVPTPPIPAGALQGLVARLKYWRHVAQEAEVINLRLSNS